MTGDSIFNAILYIGISFFRLIRDLWVSVNQAARDRDGWNG